MAKQAGCISPVFAALPATRRLEEEIRTPVCDSKFIGICLPLSGDKGTVLWFSRDYIDPAHLAELLKLHPTLLSATCRDRLS